ncbi:MAG: polysaccharide pyruvyl transferase family protein [Lachnospiraceae bacterium]|nr:polysaccharide pyruvyl transferase family protein [Lachnospiraceae bacterium]
MKIGILTLSVHGNYGGALQNFALCKAVRELGHEPITLDFKRMKHQRTKIRVFRLLQHCGGRFLMPIIGMLEPKFTLLYHIRRFADKYIPQTRVLKNELELRNAASGCDMVVVGSDQVWRKVFIYDCIGNYFLDFLPDEQRRMAYAASIGTDDCEYTDEELKLTGTLIKKFHAVSVREKSSVNLINDTFRWECNPEFVLDPTMLISPDVYKDIISQSGVKRQKGKTLFYYVLDMDRDKKECLETMAERLNLKLSTIYSTDKQELKRILKQGYSLKVEQWLAGILDADFVVTDSFHGCVFSILFNKQFVVYGNRERGMARFSSLLDTFQLADRFISSSDELTDKAFSVIDYSRVNRILKEQRMNSLNFLKYNLDN